MSALWRCAWLMACCALALAGCGGDEKQSSDKKNEPTRTASTSTTETEPDEHEGHDGEEEEEKEEEPDNPGGDGQITVTSPKPLDVVAGSIVLTGTANVFEAHVNWELVSVKKVVRSGHVMASCGSGCRGKFRTKIPLQGVPVGSYTLYVFELSAEDGKKHLHQVEIPVTVRSKPQEDIGPPPGG